MVGSYAPLPEFLVGRLEEMEAREASFDEALQLDADLAHAHVAMALHETESEVARAMLYAVQGGKGLRAFLVIESALLFGIARTHAAPAAAAIEALHSYSLVHDDLPCMDDDDLRRGKPTVHRQWDETIAVLAGDGLQALAFELVLQAVCPAEQRIHLARSLADAAGVRGMVGGQMRDIAAESSDRALSLAEITALQAGKTGALISWAASAGACMAGQDQGALRHYGDRLGLAFQIADDVLDVEGDVQAVGKAVRKDAGRGKATFVSHLGVDGAKRRASDLVAEACDALSVYGEKAETLRQAARFVISRRN